VRWGGVHLGKLPDEGKGSEVTDLGTCVCRGSFFNIEVEPLHTSQGTREVFTAIIKFNTAPLTEEKLSDDLKHLVDELWDWQVKKM
jgi:hypothetical protein